MEIRQATNFLEVLELGKILDSKVKSCRERDLNDIKLSLIAEIIEFNEECEGDTHKTWKTDKKVFSIEKAKREAIDILFFLAQMINYIFEDDGEYTYKLIKKGFSFDMKSLTKSEVLKVRTVKLMNKVLNLDEVLGYTDSRDIIRELAVIYVTLGMTEEEVYKRHFDKWKENYYNRVGTEWN